MVEKKAIPVKEDTRKKLQSVAGVWFREHATRKARPGSKQPDRYFQLVYKYRGKTINEALGWESEGWTEPVVVALVAKLSLNRAQGIYPGTVAEYRQQNEAEQAKTAEAKAAQAAEAEHAALRMKTFSDVWPLYLEKRKAEVYNPRTAVGEECAGNKWLVPHFGDRPLSEITEGDILAFVRECQRPTQKVLERKKKVVPRPRSQQTVTPIFQDRSLGQAACAQRQRILPLLANCPSPGAMPGGGYVLYKTSPQSLQYT